MNQQPTYTYVLFSIERKIVDVTRLIENEEYTTAIEKIQPLRRNLIRIQDVISTNTFQTLENCLGNLLNMCMERRDVSLNNRRRNTYHASPVYTGNRGRPRLNMTKEQLELLIAENYTAKSMAQLFGCSTKLIYKKCNFFGLHLKDKYFNGTEEVLRQEIMDLHNNFPNSGSQMMLGYLRAKGMHVQREKVRKILSEIDPVGTAQRWSYAIHRRSYKVPTPNSLWHMDAHLKLIRWNFAVHGCIDGYSRLILYVKCSTSMMANTVVSYFASAVVEYGLPSRVRSDFGYENLFVAMMMNALRGINRSSHITGRSVHNQRIERLWVDVYKEVIDYFYKEFYTLEEEGLLNIEDINHMYALQNVYLQSINEKLNLFKNAWNSHKIRTAGRKTPRQLWLSGILENINSNYTATTEIFHDNQDLYTRVLNSFEIEQLNIPVVSTEESNSNLRIQLTLSPERENEIQRILLSEAEDRVKYLEIVTFLNENN